MANHAYTAAEAKLLLLARSRWTRRVLEEQLMPALGKKVPLFATAQIEGATIRVQTVDAASLELSWHEVRCDDTARAVRFVQRLPRWRASDAAVLAEEMRGGGFEELRVAHRVMHTLDVPATSLEVAHRLAHLAPDAAALLGRALRIEAQLRQVGNALSFAAKRAAGLVSHVGLAIGLTCLVLNSMALNQAIRRRDAVSRASLASSVVLDATSCGLFTTALVAVACKAAKLAAILSTAALPVSVAALAVPPLVRHLWTKKRASEAACAHLGALLAALQQPLQKDEELKIVHFSPLVPVCKVDFRQGTFTLGSVSIEGNNIFMLNAPKSTKKDLDVVGALGVFGTQPLAQKDHSEEMWVLPMYGDISLGWSVHFTATSFALSSCQGLEHVSKLKENGFSFYNGLYAVHDVKTVVADSSVKILLDSQDRTLALAPEEWFPDRAGGEPFDMCYTFVGSGGKTVVHLEKRRSGYNIIRLEHDANVAAPSTWIIRTGSLLRLAYFNSEKYIFSGDGINVVLTKAEKNLLFFVYDDVIYSFEATERKYLPKIVLSEWIKRHQDDFLKDLSAFDADVELQEVACVDLEGKDVSEASIYFDSESGALRADHPDGHYYTSSGTFNEEGALIFHLDTIDLSKQAHVSFSLLRRMAKKCQLSILASELGLHGYFDKSSGLLFMISEDKKLYAFSNSTAALVGLDKSCLDLGVPQIVDQMSTNFKQDPALSLFPDKQPVLAEQLIVLNTRNLWILPFEKKIAHVDLSADLQIVGCIFGSAIFFDPCAGALYSSPLLPLDVDWKSEGPNVHQFQGFGRFCRVEKSSQDCILATTVDGLVFEITASQKLVLLEKFYIDGDTFSTLCLKTMSAGIELVPVTCKNTGSIHYFVDPGLALKLPPLENHSATDIVYLGRLTEAAHLIFSSKYKQIIQIHADQFPTALLTCDFASKQENALLIFDPELPIDMKVMNLISELRRLDTLIIATGLKEAHIDFSFEKFGCEKFVLDPLLKTSPVHLKLHFSEIVSREKIGRELFFSGLESKKMLIVHRGQRENVTVEQ